MFKPRGLDVIPQNWYRQLSVGLLCCRCSVLMCFLT